MLEIGKKLSAISAAVTDEVWTAGFPGSGKHNGGGGGAGSREGSCGVGPCPSLTALLRYCADTVHACVLHATSHSLRQILRCLSREAKANACPSLPSRRRRQQGARYGLEAGREGMRLFTPCHRFVNEVLLPLLSLFRRSLHL